jgi:hypothetical protein
MVRVFGASLFISCWLYSGCSTTSLRSAPPSCPVCGKPVADGPEVRVLLPGEPGLGKRYRCFVCPIMEGATGRSWTLRAVSGLDSRWVTFRIDGDFVDADPPTAVVLVLKVGQGQECLDVHRVFTDEDEFRRYVAGHPALAGTRSRTLADVMREFRK